MRSRSLFLCLALAGAPTTGCAVVGDPCSTPVTGTASFVSASLPPPHHREWTVRLEEGAGSVTWSPGYGSAERWTATFTPDAALVAQACRDLRDLPDRDTAPGGGTLRVRWEGGSGRSTRLTTSDDRAGDRVLAVVPAPALAEVRSGFARWARAHDR